MKKPGKPKPKRRARRPEPQVPSRAPALAVVSREATGIATRPTPRSPVPAAVAGLRMSTDERQILALMLVPVLIVVVFLAYNQHRRQDLHRGFDAAFRAPAPVTSTARPAPPATPPLVRQSEAPVPGPQVAMAPARPPVAVSPPLPAAPSATAPPAPPVDIPLPGMLRYPPPLPTIDLPPPVPFVPPHAIVYPPAPPYIDVAALDVRPLPVPAPPPAAMPLPAPESVATAPVPTLPVETGQQCAASSAQLTAFSSIGRFTRAPRQPRLVGVDSETFGRRLAAAAVEQTRDLVIYSARYQAMAYPMGDVMGLYGACIDVIIRAYRTVGIDLQEEVQRARGARGDPNIDHRRTENMRRFFERHAMSLPVSAFPEDYKPGDIVTYHRPFSRVSTSHIAIVSDVLAPTGRPMIVHNRGYGAQLEDALFVDRITGHYRYSGGPLSTPATGPSSKPGPAASGEAGQAPRPRASQRVGTSPAGPALTQ